jgi:hypothetical protein
MQRGKGYGKGLNFMEIAFSRLKISFSGLLILFFKSKWLLIREERKKE